MDNPFYSLYRKYYYCWKKMIAWNIFAELSSAIMYLNKI